ncbi:MAG: DUF4215 domain-containing protein, partial [Deltaproteobacteria bacterium]|nr:DUF4215 domain-containing protein [Deltaproteobacteria bacterium]
MRACLIVTLLLSTGCSDQLPVRTPDASNDGRSIDMVVRLDTLSTDTLSTDTLSTDTLSTDGVAIRDLRVADAQTADVISDMTIDQGAPDTTVDLGTPDTCAPIARFPALCGNGAPDQGESCDDGDEDLNDQCPSGFCGSCQPARCGDGFIWLNNELCDDGNDATDDACPSGPEGTCEPASCNDGFLHAGVETCEDGNTTPGDGCSSTCAIEANWYCSGPLKGSCSKCDINGTFDGCDGWTYTASSTAV